MIPPFYRLKQLPVTASTNADAKRAAEAGEAEGLVIQALHQTGGKGRQGRAWDSPEGNLYMSILLRPGCSPQEAGLYSIVTALAVYDTVREFLPDATIALKWPNDVLVNGKKISGILLEAAPVAQGVVEWLVIGVGVNVQHHPENGLYPTTSLVAEGLVAPPPVAATFDADAATGGGATMRCFLHHFDRWRLVLQNEGFAPLRAAWLARAKKGPMEARLSRETVRGVFQDLNAHGCLILRLPDGAERAIAAGDVFFR